MDAALDLETSVSRFFCNLLIAQVLKKPAELSSKSAEFILLVASRCLLAVNVESGQTDILFNILREMKLQMNLMEEGCSRSSDAHAQFSQRPRFPFLLPSWGQDTLQVPAAHPSV